jgi:methionyl-tRNA formyltransferase
MRIIIATIKSWNIERAFKLKEKYRGVHEVEVYTDRDEFSYENVAAFNPDYIFIPHWSYFISEQITEGYECVVFHMTDLPYGRGGSPLQNLIVRGHKDTKVSAIKVTNKLDAGPIYMKKPLSLDGSATEIFVRCADLIFDEMIPSFLNNNLKAVPQQGTPVVFKRRTKKDGQITADMELGKIYDYIRMLDGEGYPRAYMEFGDYRLEFDKAVYDDKTPKIEAHVTFIKSDSQKGEEN